MAFTVPRSLRHEGEPIKGSRFIVDIAPVASEAQAREVLATVAADFPDASHHCWAWRIASPAIDRANDDGEPSGSAGRPILAQLTGRDLVDTAAIVTRFFGGTKLGVGGLMRAYGGAAGQALDTLSRIPRVAMTEVSLSHEHRLTDAVERAIASVGGTVTARSYDALVKLDISLPAAHVDSLADQLADLTAGKTQLTKDDT